MGRLTCGRPSSPPLQVEARLDAFMKDSASSPGRLQELRAPLATSREREAAGCGDGVVPASDTEAEATEKAENEEEEEEADRHAITDPSRPFMCSDEGCR